MQSNNNPMTHNGNYPQQSSNPSGCLNFSNIPTQFPVMHQPPQNMVCVPPNNGMQMQGMQGMQGMQNMQNMPGNMQNMPGNMPGNMPANIPNMQIRQGGNGSQWPIQSKSYASPHPANCKCRSAQLQTFPPQPQGIPLMPLGGSELYPVGNLNCMIPVGQGQNAMCMFGNQNYTPQSYIEPGMYVDPLQWKQICKQQATQERCSKGGQK